MIVSDSTVEKALAYLAEDPHPIALAKKDLTDAENERDRIYAEVYAAQEGTIRERDMACERDPQVIQARKNVAAALFDVERHKARTNAGGMVIEVWRSENANARAAERVR
jgi:hypothetical protein